MDFILIFKAIVMGIIEGITEFLPISSTGHLIIFGSSINFKGAFADSFEIIIQFGAIIAVIIYYRSKIINSFKSLYASNNFGKDLWTNVVVALIPTIVVGVLFKNFFKSLFKPNIVGIFIIIGAVLLYVGESIMKDKNNKDSLDKIKPIDAFRIGLFQVLAMLPGMSRSGSTITGGLFSGLNSRTAAEFSFFLAIPTMLGTALFELKDIQIINSSELISLIIGFIIAFIVAYIVVGAFLKFLGKHSLKGFVYYRVIIGLIILILVTTGVII